MLNSVRGHFTENCISFGWCECVAWYLHYFILFIDVLRFWLSIHFHLLLILNRRVNILSKRERWHREVFGGIFEWSFPSSIIVRSEETWIGLRENFHIYNFPSVWHFFFLFPLFLKFILEVTLLHHRKIFRERRGKKSYFSQIQTYG